MPSESAPPSGWVDPKSAEFMAAVRCTERTRFFLGGAFVEDRCTRDGRHKRRRSGHIVYFNSVDGDGRPLRKPDGSFVRVKYCWDGDTHGEGRMSPEGLAMVRKADEQFMEAARLRRKKKVQSGG